MASSHCSSAAIVERLVALAARPIGPRRRQAATAVAGRHRSGLEPWPPRAASAAVRLRDAGHCQGLGDRLEHRRRRSRPASGRRLGAAGATCRGGGGEQFCSNSSASARTRGRRPRPAAAAARPAARARRPVAADPDRSARGRARRGTASSASAASPAGDGFRRGRESRRGFRARS